MIEGLQEYRDFYARFIVASGGGKSERLVAAFASVAREDFLGAGPWLLWTGAGYLETLSADPRHVYHDVVVALLPHKKINNGQPTLHARCLAAMDPHPGESLVHIGAGTGYYTAVMRELVGPAAAVDAYEIEEALAERAARAFRGIGTVRVHCENASTDPIPPADLIYVNAGVTSIPDHWLEALNDGGRLVVPLTPDEGFGGMLMVTRRSADAFAAEILGRVAFIPCTDGRDKAESAALAAAFEPHTYKHVRSLQRGSPPDESAWYVGSNWWLSTKRPQAPLCDHDGA